MDIKERRKLQSLIEDLTKTGDWFLDDEILKLLKKIVKKSDDNVRTCFQLLWERLQKDHSQIRYSCLLLTNELFLRSKVFREMLADNFDDFVELVVGTRVGYVLPKPHNFAENMRKKALEFIEVWHDKYGQLYRSLDLGFKYLKYHMQMTFPEVRQNEEKRRQEEEARAEKSRRLMRLKFRRVREELDEEMPLIEVVLNAMDECFELLVPTNAEEVAQRITIPKSDPLHEGTNAATGSDPAPVGSGPGSTGGENVDDEFELPPCSDDEYEYVYESASDGEDAIPERTSREDEVMRTVMAMDRELNNGEITVDVGAPVMTEDASNRALFDALRDNYRELQMHYLPLAKTWMEIVSGVEVGEFATQSNIDECFKRVVDVQQKMKASCSKCEDLGCAPNIQSGANDADADDDCEFEEVQIPLSDDPPASGGELVSKPVSEKQATSIDLFGEESDSDVEIQPDSKVAVKPRSAKVGTGTEARRLDPVFSSARKRGKEGTPSSKIYDSESDKAKYDRSALLKTAPVVPMGLDLLNWDMEKMPAHANGLDVAHRFLGHGKEGAETAVDHTRISIYQSKDDGPIKWTCRFPLKNGKLCPRRDRSECPFHGPVVPRDSTGKRTDGKEDVAMIQREKIEKEKLEQENPDKASAVLLNGKTSAKGKGKAKTTAVEDLIAGDKGKNGEGNSGEGSSMPKSLKLGDEPDNELDAQFLKFLKEREQARKKRAREKRQANRPPPRKKVKANLVDTRRAHEGPLSRLKDRLDKGSKQASAVDYEHGLLKARDTFANSWVQTHYR